MTPSELAKVRELVEAQREVWMRETSDPFAVGDGSSSFSACERSRDRHRRAFLAVEAMVAEPMPRLYTAEEVRQHGAREAADAVKEAIETLGGLRALHELRSHPAPEEPQS